MMANKARVSWDEPLWFQVVSHSDRKHQSGNELMMNAYQAKHERARRSELRDRSNVMSCEDSVTATKAGNLGKQ